MDNKTSLLQFLKPGIPKRYLLFIAALAWTFAGSILLYRGYLMMILYPENFSIKVIISVLIGIVFFILVFSKISLNHTIRIVNLTSERPCLFSFFNWQSYIMMAIMMSVGITLRTSGIISPKYLSFFYIIMGTPLFLSAFRFYFFGIFYEKAENRIIKK
jgi:hypothetical protein